MNQLKNFAHPDSRMEAYKTPTFGDLLEVLKILTPEQLTQPIRTWEEGAVGRVYALDILIDDFVSPSGEGCEPLSVYTDPTHPGYDPETAEGMEDEPVIYCRGTVLLNTDIQEDAATLTQKEDKS